MNETSTAQYTSDLFVLEYDLLAKDYPWVAWAECGIDAMNQAVVRFHNLRPEGLGHDAFGWYDNLYLRRNRLANSIELVFEEDGYGDFCVVEAVWDKIDEHLWHALVSACTELDAQAAFVIMLEITKADLRIRELTTADEVAFNALPLTPGDDMHRAHLRKEARQIAALMRLEGHPFNTVVKAVQECNPEEPAPGANRVYLPDQLSALCTTDAAQIDDVPCRWFALTVDPSAANPDYLAAALNMPLGTIIRESLQSPHMPRLQPAAFADATLYLPPLPDQDRIVRATEQIRAWSQELNELNNSLWEEPSELDTILARLAMFAPNSR